MVTLLHKYAIFITKCKMFENVYCLKNSYENYSLTDEKLCLTIDSIFIFLYMYKQNHAQEWSYKILFFKLC